ncbi:MAG: 30S ribosomal protein S17 [bacterium]|nr:30S ribosomal protein S17 [bacterium]
MAEQKRIIQKKGIVVSDKMDKTRVVQVEVLTRHPVYLKTIRKRKKFYAHDELNMSKLGDVVVIKQCRPLSKLKRWKVAEIVQKAVARGEGVINGTVENDS